MQYVVDSYILEYIESKDKYYISFKDSVENDCRIEINKEIFETYIKSKKAYIKIKNETSRHLEQIILTDEELYNKSKIKGKSTEDIVIDNIEQRKIYEAKKLLTNTQLRRIELHIIDKIGTRELARIEKVRRKQVEKSIDAGLKKLEKFLKNFDK